jgi:hypothetical protein
VFFRVWVAFFTFPEDYGWFGIWKGHFDQYRRLVVEQWEKQILVRCLVAAMWGNQNRMISLKSMVVTMEALSLVVGKASIHLGRVSMKTRRYLAYLTGDMLVKSTCQSDPGK